MCSVWEQNTAPGEYGDHLRKIVDIVINCLTSLSIWLEIAFTIATPAFDILFIGCVLNTKIVYTTAKK